MPSPSLLFLPQSFPKQQLVIEPKTDPAVPLYTTLVRKKNTVSEEKYWKKRNKENKKKQKKKRNTITLPQF